jgi:hypothetical protein
MDPTLEVVTLAVSDIDRATQVYGAPGWRADGDFRVDEHTRAAFATRLIHAGAVR